MQVLVTGASGFLGRYIVKLLCGRGYQISTLGRHTSKELDGFGVKQFVGDIGNYDSVFAAMQDCTAVFHVAAKAGFWGDFDGYHESNVIGTSNVIKACRVRGVKYLIYTSSPSVVYDGQDQCNVDETAKYPQRYLSNYPRTKATAEQLVLSANGDTVYTLALRPHLLWGPGDNHILPRLVKMARQGHLYLIGSGANKIDAVYVENAAQAHLNAFDALMVTPLKVGGRPYFITNHDPRKLVDLIHEILSCYDVSDRGIRHIPYPLAYFLGQLMETAYRVFRLQNEPKITRFIVKQLGTSHFYDGTKAKSDLGYVPAISMEEGFKRLRCHRDSWIALEDEPNALQEESS